MYTHFFKLREPPFSITPDPTYLYLSPRHQEALGHLLYGTGQHGGFVQLTGEVGTGKTTIVRTLLAQKLDNVDVAVILNPRQSEQEFVQSICDELHVPYPRHSTEQGPTGASTATPANAAPISLKVLHDALNAHLLSTHAAGRRTVVIIDEAQNLERNVLEQVRLLTNLETHKDKLLRIMLVGQPELAQMLSRADLRQLSTRITARYHLTPLSPAETGEYIRHRLRIAGCSEELFSKASIALIHRLTGGVPRLVNILCDRSLLGAYARNERVITPAIVQGASAEALGDLTPPKGKSLPFWKLGDRRRWSLSEVMMLVGIVAVAIYWIGLQRQKPIATAVASADPQHAEVVAPTAAASSTGAIQPAAPVAASAAAPKAETPMASTSAPAPTLRDVFNGSEPLAVVTSRLIRLWSPRLTLPAGEQVCPALAAKGLQCYRAQGDWKDVQMLNRPAILTLANGRGIVKYVLLRDFDGDDVVLDTTQSVVKIHREELGAAWTGEFLVLWRPPTDELRISVATRGPAVVWLRQQLALASGTVLKPPVSEFFDNALREQVMRFQRDRGLDADGVAGARTQMLLSALTSDPAEPRLRTAAGDAVTLSSGDAAYRRVP